MISMAWICYIKIDEIPEVTLELKKKKMLLIYISVIWFEISLSEVASCPHNSENIQLLTSDEFWC